VGIRLTTGSLRNCALFDPSTIVRDEAGGFVARGAVAETLSDCSDASLGGTVPAVCGDAVVDPSTEECDGGPGPGCAGDGCFPPGDPQECMCCTSYVCDPISGDTPCCDDGASCLPFGINFSFCHDPTCGPGEDCAFGQDCVDGTCCVATLQAKCYFDPASSYIPCCAPAVCVPEGAEGFCRLPPGESCGIGPDCISGSCVGGVCS
jgi:hypothetical protein